MKRLRTLLRLSGELLTVGLRDLVAELDEAAKSLPDREYARGYADGVRDGRAVAGAERADEAGGSRQPYPNE